MKPEIKHLAKRLPYGLKVINTGDLMDIREIVIGVETQWDTRNSVTIWQVLNGIFNKPVLFPLSALTQEITINGETFVPIYRMLEVIVQEGENRQHAEFLLNKIITNELDINALPFFVYEMLLSWHFDTDGLIDAGLAISVFDLPENPYK